MLPKLLKNQFWRNMRFWGIVSAAVLFTFLECFLKLSPAGESFERSSLKYLYALRGPVPAPQNIAIVAMDEPSYRQLGVPFEAQWPREIHAKLVDKLAALGARRVVMDILFLDASQESRSDAALRNAFSHVPTVLAADFGSLDQSVDNSLIYGVKVSPLLRPDEMFSSVAEATALAKMPVDDGIIVRMRDSEVFGDSGLPIMYEAAARGLANLSREISDRDLVRYYGPQGAITTFSYKQILDDTSPSLPDFFRGKVVFVGIALRTGLGPQEKDSYMTPISDNVFGVEIQATAAANLIEGRWIKRSSWQAELVFCSALAFLVCALIFSLRPDISVVLLFFFSAAWAVLSFYLFKADFFMPGLTLFPVLYLAFTFSAIAYYLITYRAQRNVEKAFSVYLPPHLAREMRTSTDALKPGGQEMVATAFFSDIEGFTSTAENQSATQISELLNNYFNEVVSVIFKHDGTVIKFIGDSVFALWGAPVKMADHARKACEAALSIRAALDARNLNRPDSRLRTRIGINTGPMVVGNLGAASKLDYTAVGDAVNMASRLENLNKLFGTDILVSETSLSPDVKDAVCLGQIRVAGKRKPTAIYTFFREPLSPDILSGWNAALKSCAAGNEADARNALGAFSSNPVLGPVAGLYLDKLQEVCMERGVLVIEQK